MATNKRKYYDKRQVITMQNVSTGDYTERILLCLPKFGWLVARAFLSTQGQWRSTYADTFNGVDYTIPDEATFDQIFSSIDSTLAEDDMSCDLRQGLDEIRDAIAALQMVVNCGSTGGCCTSVGGSGGAGSVIAEPSDFEDDGENYPGGFADRAEYDAYKCAIADHIVSLIITDIKYLQELDVTEIVASVLIVTLLTPIAGDEVIALVGGILLMATEAILDVALDHIITELEDGRDELVCIIYNALDASSLYNSLVQWLTDKLNAVEVWIASKFFGIDVLNWVFGKVHQLIDLDSADCSSCPVAELWAINYNLGVIDYQDETGEGLDITATFGHAGNNTDHWWIACGLNVNADYALQVETIVPTGWTNHNEWPNYAVTGYYNQAGTWVPFATIAELVGSVIYPGRMFHVLGGSEFSVEITFSQVTI